MDSPLKVLYMVVPLLDMLRAYLHSLTREIFKSWIFRKKFRSDR